MNNPTLLVEPICTGGTIGTDYNIITDTSVTTGALTQKYGFPSVTEQSLTEGGVPPSRQDFNGMMYLLSSILFVCQKGRVFDYDATQAYGAHALVWSSNKLWWCKADAAIGTPTPANDTSNTYWIEAEKYLYSLLVSGNIIQWSDVQNKPSNVSYFTNDANYQNATEAQNIATATVAPIYQLIPSEASSVNKLADKEWVDTEIDNKASIYFSMYNNGTSGNITPTNGAMQVTSATSITMGTTVVGKGTKLALWCVGGAVTFSNNVSLPSNQTMPSGSSGVAIYELEAIEPNKWAVITAGLYSMDTIIWTYNAVTKVLAEATSTTAWSYDSTDKTLTNSSSRWSYNSSTRTVVFS